VISVIENKPPIVNASASTNEGYAPLSVSFNATSSDVDGVVVKYEWDFEGDGTYDFSSATSPAASFTYQTKGTYNATLNVTDNKGKSTKTTISINVKENKYPGFDKLSLFIGSFWRYKWVYDSKTNGSVRPQKTGFTTIEIVDTVSVTFNVIGKLKLYKTRYVGSGDVFPLTWYGRPYLAFKDGTMYIAQVQNGSWGAAVLFDSRSGEFFGSQGFVGYFSENRNETLSTGPVTNTFNTAYSGNAVIVSEPFFQPACQTIAGVQVCGTSSHDYQVKEYFFPGIGFGGFYRSGTSVFTGGGIVDIFQTTMTVWLVDTNVK
jgi:PKD repeat protein